ncbi:MAG: hypothetical protein JST04_16895 [Bdellovibrionales bacterium]|nr:hypothetical protein [Bdellovibrionales bacterium]
MNPRFCSLFSVTLLAIAVSATAFAAPGRPAKAGADGSLQEIQVTLFGQPCTMSGPFPRASLALLHEISPEKLPPDQTVEQMKRVRAKTNELKGMPMPIEQYRDHLRKRLSAKIAFEEAVVPARKAKNARRALDTFLTNVKEHISTLQYPSFAETTKKSFEALGSAWTESFVGPLRERFENSIQPDTEEEFHKAIRTVKIQYVCAFDDSDHRSDDDGDE